MGFLGAARHAGYCLIAAEIVMMPGAGRTTDVHDTARGRDRRPRDVHS